MVNKVCIPTLERGNEKKETKLATVGRELIGSKHIHRIATQRVPIWSFDDE